MNEALITPVVMRWARERNGVSQAQLASSLHVTAEQISAWEKGVTHPPFPKAQALAKTLKIPFGFLFLSNPPSDQTPIPDLRTIDDERYSKPSPDFMDLLDEVLVKQDWFREIVLEQGGERIPFVGRFRRDERVSVVAADIRKELQIDKDLRGRVGSWDDYLRAVIQNAEAQGILVMRSGVVRGNTHRPLSVNEFRGFVVADEIAPLVFLNSKDAKAAQIFTLAHEIVHIWIGQAGITNPDPGRSPSVPQNNIESFCNKVAAEILVPGEEFLTSWISLRDKNTYEKAQQLARAYRVSVPVILRRALDLGKVTRNDFFELIRQHRLRVEQIEAQKADQSSTGGNFYNSLWARNSKRLTDAVLDATRAGRLSSLEAGTLLNVKAATLPKLIEHSGL
jgi:Zn-dependent peptidase ImmA (M78 family)/DNA-binding XRE family transcriptional regulator